VKPTFVLEDSGRGGVVPAVQPLGLQLPSRSVLFCTHNCRLAGIAAQIQCLLRGPDGKVSDIQFEVPAGSALTATTNSFPLPDGVLLGVQMRSSGSGLFIGVYFARLWVQTQATTQPKPGIPLDSGWVTNTGGPGWPAQQATEFTGPNTECQLISVTSPAAGAEWSYTLVQENFWELLTVGFTLTADATVTTRTPRVEVDDGATVLCVFDPALGQTAGQIIRYLGCASGVAPTTSLGDRIFPTAGVALRAAFRIRTLTSNLQAADAYSAIRLTFRGSVSV